MSQDTKSHPRGTMPLDLTVEVDVRAKHLTDFELAACEQKAYAAAHRAAADYVKGVLASREAPQDAA